MSDFDFIQVNLTQAELWGQLAEEAAELAQAALKMQRVYMTNNPPRKSLEECMASVIEEHADLALCFELLGWSDKDARKQVRKEKLARWAAGLRALLIERSQ